MKKALILCAMLTFLYTTYAMALEFGDVAIHGFLSQGYLKTDTMNYLAKTKDGSAEFNEMAINFSTILSPGLRAGLQVFAYDMGERGNDDLKLEWCYGDYQWREWLGLRIGKMKAVFGLYNEIRDIDLLRTAIFLPVGIYSEVSRDEQQSLRGISIYGELGLSNMGTLAYSAMFGRHNFSTDGGFAVATESILKNRFGGTTSFKIEEMAAGHVRSGSLKWETFIEGLVIGINGFDIEDFNWNASGVIFTKMNSWWGYVSSIQYSWNDFVLTGEYYKRYYVYTTGGSADLPPEPTARESAESWYINVINRFSQLYEIGLTYSEYYPNVDDKDGTQRTSEEGPDFLSWAKSYTFSNRFDVAHNWCFKLEFMHTDGQALFNNAENDDDLERNWNLYAAKITYMF